MMQVAEILLVEDDPRDVRVAVEALRDAKVRNSLHVAADGIAALSFLRHGGKYADAPTPDLILLDLDLPLKDGRQVLQEIKADDRLKLIPVVVLTTSRNDEDVISSCDLHVHGYITKPVDFDQFLRTVLSADQLWFSIVTTAPLEWPQGESEDFTHETISFSP
jgi:chemotaxis family two-component system response regulator Rcp1